MDEQLSQARVLIKAGRYSEARAILIKLDHPTAQKWLQQLDQIAPALPNENTKSLTSQVLVVLGGVMLILTLLLAFYAAFLRPVGAAQAEVETVKNAVSDMDKKLSTIQTDITSKTSDNQTWEYLLFQYGQINECSIEGRITEEGCFIEFPNTNDPTYDIKLWGGSKCNTNKAPDFECLKKDFKGSAFYLDKLGSDGWELINVVNTSSTSYHVEMYFKRIKQIEIKESPGT